MMQTFRKQYELSYPEFDKTHLDIINTQKQAMKIVFGSRSKITHTITDPRLTPMWMECETDELEYLRQIGRVRIKFKIEFNES